MVLLDLLHIQRAGFFKFLKSGLNEELSQLNINIENTRLEILPFEPKADSKSFTDKQLNLAKTYKGATTIKQIASTSQIVTPNPESICSANPLLLPIPFLDPLSNAVPLCPSPKAKGTGCKGYASYTEGKMQGRRQNKLGEAKLRKGAETDGLPLVISNSLASPRAKTFQGCSICSLPYSEPKATGVSNPSSLESVGYRITGGNFLKSEAKTSDKMHGYQVRLSMPKAKTTGYRGIDLINSKLSSFTPKEVRVYRGKQNARTSFELPIPHTPVPHTPYPFGVQGYRDTAKESNPSYLGKEKETFINLPIALPEKEQTEKTADNTTNSEAKNACFCLIAPKYTPREAILYQKSWSCKLVVKVLLTVHTESKVQRLEQPLVQVGDNKLTHTSGAAGKISEAGTKGLRGSKKPKGWTKMEESRKEGRESKILELGLPLKSNKKDSRPEESKLTKIEVLSSPITKDMLGKNLPVHNISPEYLKVSDEKVIAQDSLPLKDLRSKESKLTHMVVKEEKGYRVCDLKGANSVNLEVLLAKNNGYKGKMQTPGLSLSSSKRKLLPYSEAKGLRSKAEKGHELFLVLGELPLMTKRGHFIINGSPRVILSQLIRTPGIYFTERDNELQADCVPEQGPWLCISKNFRETGSPLVTSSANPSVSVVNSQFLSDNTSLSGESFELPKAKEGNLKATSEATVSKGKQGEGTRVLGREAKTKSLSSYFCYTKQFSSMPFSLIYSNFRTFELHSQFTDQTLLLTKLRTLEKIRQLRELITTLLTFTWKKRTRKRLQKLYTKRCFTATQQFEKTKIIFRLKRKLILGSLGRKSFNEKLAVSNCENITEIGSKLSIDLSYLDQRRTELKESFNLLPSPKTKLRGSLTPSTFSYLKPLLLPMPFSDPLTDTIPRTSNLIPLSGESFELPKATEGNPKAITPYPKGAQVLLRKTGTNKDYASYTESKMQEYRGMEFATEGGKLTDSTPLVFFGDAPYTFADSLPYIDGQAKGKVQVNPQGKICRFGCSEKKEGVIFSAPFGSKLSPERIYETNRSKNILKLSSNVLSEGDLLSQDLSLIVRFLDSYKIMPKDDIDDLNNQRVRTSSDQVQQQVRVGCLRFRKMFIKLVRESWGVSQTITDLLNGALREFFGSNPLSQFLDQTNSLAEITHKRRISKLGLGGIQRESATLKVRTIHSTYFGRICPIETPEGVNAGLVNSLTCLSRVNEQGQLVTPLSPLIEKQLQNQFFYYSNQETQPLSTTDTALLKFQRLPNQFIYTKNESYFQQLEVHKVHLRVQSDLQTISLATALIPFLPYDDANRALMGSNMQRQAVPLILPERPSIRTGLESLVISESGHSKESPTGGFVSYVSAQFVIIICHALNKRALSF